MRIEHSPLTSDFLVFFFETSVDGELRDETLVDYLRSEWYTRPFGVRGKILLRGAFPNSLPDDSVPESIKPQVEAAIRGGHL